MATDSYIFLAGASRGVGEQIADYLTQEMPRKVKALIRSETSCPALESRGIKVVRGNALDIDSVEAAMWGEDPIDAVISTIGGLPQDGQRADYWGNINLINVAVKAGVKKFILVSSIGCGKSVVALSPQNLEVLGPVLAEKEKAEDYLINSGLTYTIVRPGVLKSEPRTGSAILTEDVRVSGRITRADVAQLVCQCLVSERSHHKILSALDRQMLFNNTPVAEFSLS